MSDKPISPLRQRMIDDMTARRFTEDTQRDYVRNVRMFAAFLGRSPDTATKEGLRRFQLRMARQQISPGSINAAIAALRFFFTVTLERPDLVLPLTTVNKPRRAPVVLSQEEVARLLEAAPGLKYKAALSVAYGAGLRVIGEGAALMTKQFAFKQRVGQCAAVHRREGEIAAAAEIVQCARGQFLAGAGLALDQRRRVDVAKTLDEPQSLTEGGRLAQQIQSEKSLARRGRRSANPFGHAPSPPGNKRFRQNPCVNARTPVHIHGRTTHAKACNGEAQPVVRRRR